MRIIPEKHHHQGLLLDFELFDEAINDDKRIPQFKVLGGFIVPYIICR